MANKKYTAALIGTGRIGFTLGFDKKREQPASHTMTLLNNKNIQIIAGCDTDAEKLEQWKKYVESKKRGQSPVKTFSTVASLFSDCTPDIVVIAVNEDSHLKTALEVIEHKPALVILEKPVALCVEEGNKIVQAAEKAGVPVLVNHERRFANDYNFAKKYLSEIGELLSVNARLDSGMRVYAKDSEATGGYSLLHDGTHLVDIVMFLLEETMAQKQVLTNMKLSGILLDKEKPDVVRNVTAHFESDVCKDVNITISGFSRYFGFEVDLVGREGRIKIGNGIHEYYKREESNLYSGFYSLGKDKKVKVTKKTGYFANMLQNAVDFLDGKAHLKSTLQTGMNTLLILEEIKNQLEVLVSN